MSAVDYFVHRGGISLCGMLLNINYAKAERLITEGDLHHVPYLYVIGSLDYLAVNADVIVITGIIGNGTALYNSGNL